MFLSLFVSGIEAGLRTIEASNDIALRMQMIAKGDVQTSRELESMVSEKLEAFARAGTDLLEGASDAIIRNNFHAVIRANELCLNALRSVASH